MLADALAYLIKNGKFFDNFDQFGEKLVSATSLLKRNCEDRCVCLCMVYKLNYKERYAETSVNLNFKTIQQKLKFNTAHEPAIHRQLDKTSMEIKAALKVCFYFYVPTLFYFFFT